VAPLQFSKYTFAVLNGFIRRFSCLKFGKEICTNNFMKAKKENIERSSGDMRMCGTEQCNCHDHNMMMFGLKENINSWPTYRSETWPFLGWILNFTKSIFQ